MVCVFSVNSQNNSMHARSQNMRSDYPSMGLCKTTSWDVVLHNTAVVRKIINCHTSTDAWKYLKNSLYCTGTIYQNLLSIILHALYMHLVLTTSQDVVLHKRIADVPRRRAPRDRKVLMPALTRAHQLIQSARTI